jgi:DNA-binding response OmpR family regulator
LKKILIVEDEITIAELERDYLEINGYEVSMAHTGSAALKLVFEKEFDLVILDLMLPEIDGFEICKRIREKLEIPILMISAKKEDIDKVRGLGLGADDYLTKPFSPNELVARVKAHISRFERLSGKEKKKKTLNIRNLTIQPESRRVYVDKDEITLTTKEYDLLYFLATNANQVFSKDILLDRIWGMDCYVDTATVTVHIGKLREKIEKTSNYSTPLIETIWGAGYRFNI